MEKIKDLTEYQKDKLETWLRVQARAATGKDFKPLFEKLDNNRRTYLISNLAIQDGRVHISNALYVAKQLSLPYNRVNRYDEGLLYPVEISFKFADAEFFSIYTKEEIDNE